MPFYPGIVAPYLVNLYLINKDVTSERERRK
jgi:hypothetical protein